MENDQEGIVEPQEQTSPEESQTTEEKTEEQSKETPEQKVARLERQLKRAKKEAGIDEQPPKPAKETVEPKAGTSDLSDTQIDYFELKGITETEDMDFLRDVMRRTGMNHREVLQDDFVKTRIKSNKDRREAEAALPNSKRATPGAKQSVEAALAEYDKSGKLPKDFELRKQVIQRKAELEGTNLPPWRRVG